MYGSRKPEASHVKPWASLACLTLTAAMAGVAAVRLGVAAQTPAAQDQRFEVASVKLHQAADDVMFALQYQRGRFVATGTLRMLIRTAYRLQERQLAGVEGGPGRWVDSDLFDITATTSADSTPEAMRLMLRALLAERFGVQLRTEVRTLPVYGLARTGSAYGPAFKTAAAECGTLPGRAPAAAIPTVCGIQYSPGRLTAGGISMPALAENLSLWADRVVVDRTGLQGSFALQLRWLPERVPDLAAPLSSAGQTSLDAVDPDTPSLFTAVREQLGLRLDPQDGPVPVFVIERAERPTAD